MRQNNSFYEYMYSENQYLHNVPVILHEKTYSEGSTVITKEVIKEIQTEVVNTITPGSGISITQAEDKIYVSSNIKGGNGIAVSTENNETVIDATSGAVLFNDHETEKHIEPIILKNGMTLDEVVDKLLEAIENNGDTIDGEEIHL